MNFLRASIRRTLGTNLTERDLRPWQTKKQQALGPAVACSAKAGRNGDWLTELSQPPADPVAIYRVLSLVFWTVILVVAIKYMLIVMRADNEGEGGTMALLTLLR